MESKKNDTNELIYKTERDSQTENRLVVINVTIREVGKINYEFRINTHTHTTKSRKGKIYPTECRAPKNREDR